METWLACLVALLGTACVAVFGMRAYQSLRRWQRKQARLDTINNEYENLRSIRKDAVYHHGWAQSRGEFKEAQDHEAHVEDIDKCIRQQFSGETKSHEEVILIMMGHSLALP
ncbi:Hypothetical protein SCF082_LOCUS53488 [Durusdinium trenchii]|uniref:Uncharacterized protein n=1 Tax=Durusdinium trenchii TaxID=1381693 RepID=A0ABP0ST13_9DINO